MKLTEQSACLILGLSAPTTLKEARKAYRALARELHPDVGGDEERFKQVSAAYQLLTSLYEDHPSRERRGGAAQPGGAAERSSRRSASSASSKRSPEDTTSGSSSRSSARSSSSGGRGQDEPTQDHRHAWRAWRDQFDQSGSTRERSNRAGRSSESRSSRAQPHEPRSDEPRSNKERGDQRAQEAQAAEEAEIVHAAVVPSWSDSLYRWGESARAQLSEVGREAQARLKSFYRQQTSGLFERGRDERFKLEIDLQTLLYGKQVRIAIKRALPCPQCQLESGALKVVEGESAAEWASGCQVCRGDGRVKRRQELSVYIPPGAEGSAKLKVSGQGAEGLNGAESGDLYLILSPPALPRGFTRRGADLELLQGVSAQLLQRGGLLPIKTVRGSIKKIKVPPQFRPGGKLMIPDEGLPMWSDASVIGSLTVKLRVISS